MTRRFEVTIPFEVTMLEEKTRALKSAGEKALAPFFAAGYPDEETFLALLNAASGAGCPVIEIGIPFSDPIADGPAIQAASKQALDQGMSLARTLALTREASTDLDAELVLMGYFNPILQMGLEPFAREARAAGASGVIIPDLPLEESMEARGVLRDHAVAFVDLVAPTSGAERIGKIAARAEGFLYLVSLTGVTGVRRALAADLGGFAARVSEHTDLPRYVGFGISNREHAEQCVQHAEGVIIGSALVRIIESTGGGREAVSRVRAFLEDIQKTLHGMMRS